MATVKREPSLRSEQAAQTRRRILEAAARVFEARGFAGARIEDVADEARVAVPTVYKVFRSKRNLLIAALDLALAGDDEAATAEQASWFTEQLDEPDPERQLHLIARNARHLCERAGPLLTVLRMGASQDQDLARAWDDFAAQRVTRSQRTAGTLIKKAGGRARGTRADIATTLLSLTVPDLFVTYTSAGRSGAQYERWLADLLSRAILD